MKLAIDSARLLDEIESLALISEAEPPVVTRVVFTPADMRARVRMREHCEAAGLKIRTDAVGNTFARWDGSEPDAPVVGTGSHIDAIPNAGKFDGVVGVLGGLEAIRALQKNGLKPRHSIELLIFTSEEPTRFGIGCLGSRLLSGALAPDAARKLTDKNGEKLDDVRRSAGMSGELEDVKLADGYYKAFVELHIEQGPLLEKEKVPLGVVTKIAAPASAYVTIEGAGGHAGGVLMPDRRDALCAAAETILVIESAARMGGSIDTVATVGICDVFPGAVNSIPSRVRISVDVRDTNLTRRNGVIRAIELASEVVSARRGVSSHVEMLNADAPADCAREIVDALSAACGAHGEKFMPMVSRAYHDSLFLARIAPVAMLFIPCRNGYSHRPDEYSSIEDISRGVLILAETLASLSA
ncbi:MAG TPA: M20 family metallo-hydrolase [Candidatus Acidoferrum sp.]|jgi:ureidoglycolate amidohydrolase|nr:M20 family metallo-hydrolase [Candidatus Acidoferrum sp.]